MEERNGYFAVHSQGLGHATRSVALARGLAERDPRVSFLFLAASPALDLVVSSGFDALTMPPAPDFPTREGVLQPMWRWYWDYARYLRTADRFMRREGDWAYYRFLISDSELAAVRAAVRHRVPTALIVNQTAHDFARGPGSRLVEGIGNLWFSGLARRVDVLLVSGPAPDWPNVKRVGPIVRTPSASREKLRDDLVFRKRTILVTVGGTATGEFLLREAVQSFGRLDLPDTSMVVVSGPKLKVDPAPGVYVYGFVPNLQDFVLASDLVVTLAGQGTVNEARASGTPVIAIPPKGHAEAERNAAELGYRFEDVRRLDELMPEKLALGRMPRMATGNDEAVDLLLRFLDDKVPA
jgi:UDP-N-acetylglucosamine--N-acetylmuramyl-(pentapeptide) pyrophosphoryl-undecaprenol N-acetylglucosamine transferase